jgi:predicted kinase
VLLARVAARAGDASDATPAVVRQQLTYEPGGFSEGWARVEAGASPAATLEKAREALAQLG